MCLHLCASDALNGKKWRKLIRGKLSHIVTTRVKTADEMYFQLIWSQLTRLLNEFVVGCRYKDNTSLGVAGVRQ